MGLDSSASTVNVHVYIVPNSLILTCEENSATFRRCLFAQGPPPGSALAPGARPLTASSTGPSAGEGHSTVCQGLSRTCPFFHVGSAKAP